MVQRSVVVVSVVVLGGLAGWAALSWRNADRRADQAARQLGVDSDQIEQLREEATKRVTLAEDTTRQLLQKKRELRDVRRKLAPQKIRLGNLEVLETAFIAPGQDLYQAHILDPEDAQLLLLEWADDKAIGTAGLQIWSSSSTTPTSWELAFAIEPHPRAAYVSIGPPTATRRESSDANSAFFTAFGDVTGDGRSDVAIQQWNSGSGGCGVVRVLENSTRGLSEIFRRDDCDHRAQIRGGQLVYSTSFAPRGCRAAHGCGTKETTMRWAGTDWEVVDVARSVFER